MFVCANIALLSSPLIFGLIIREVQVSGVHEENMYYVLSLLSLLFFKDLIFWLFHGPARVLERTVAFRIALRYRTYLLEGVLDSNLSWHNEHDSGDTIEKIRKAVDGLYSFGENIFQIIQTLVRMIGTSIVLFFFSPAISVIVFMLVVMSLWLIFFFDRKLLSQVVRLNEFGNKASASIFDALSNVTSVKILHIENTVSKGVVARFAAPFQLFCSNVKLNEWKWFTGIMLFQAISIIPLGSFIFYKVQTQQDIDAGTVSTLYLYLSELMFVYFVFGSFYEQLCMFRNGVLNASGIEEHLQTTKKIERKLISQYQSISFQDLSFSYTPLATAFDKLNLTISKGEKIAIIGESGSGKTTFLKIIHGMYPSASANICIDTESPQRVGLADVDFKTMLVPQDPEIFSSSIRENLTLGIEYTENQLQEALRIARFSSVITTLPKGLDSVINEKGVNLSGGQRQRLALARAILFSEGKDWILLDESTSSVDSENEIEIYKNIVSVFAEKTIIASIHKMNLLRFFDRILIFDKCSIVDDGSFDELLAKNSRFRQSWQQFREV